MLGCLGLPSFPASSRPSVPGTQRQRWVSLVVDNFRFGTNCGKRRVLENAPSIAGLMITTECLVTEAPEKKEKAAAPIAPEEY